MSCFVVSRVMYQKTVDNMEASGVKDLRAREFRQGTQSTVLERFYYQKLIRGDYMVDCFPLKTLGAGG